MKPSILILICVLLLSFASFPVRSEDSHVLQALARKDFSFLNTTLNGVQRSFEEGHLSEIELRNAFRPFRNLNSQQQEALRAWPKNSPDSYAAQLALGIFLKSAGWEARGGKFISETSSQQINEMLRLFELSRSELNRSLRFAEKPYLTVFHLLDIARAEGDHVAELALLTQANRLLPSNHLARNRYLVSITPRWGGSYEQMRQFILEASKDGADQEGVMQLEAIIYNDQGDAALRTGDHAVAKSNFLKALDLAQKVGGSFREDFLQKADRYICGKSKEHPLCK